MDARIDRSKFLRAGATTLAGATLGGVVAERARGGARALEAQEAAAVKRGGVLVVGQDTSPPGIDPQKDAAFATLNVTELMYNSLLRWDASETKIEPDLATSWKQLDKRTFVFNLRKGVRFHNGQPFTSDDVKATFERIADPKVGSPWRSIFSVIARIDAPSDHTVIFHLKTPFAPFLNYMATPWYTAISNREDVKQRGDLLKGGAGTGPFMLASYAPDVAIKLKRNPSYHERGKPYLDGLELRVITDESTRVAALRNGTIHTTWVGSPRVANQMKNVKGVHVDFPKTLRFEEGLEFDHTKPPFNDVRVRRAFSLALDRKGIIDVVLLGDGGLGTKIPPGAQPYGYTSKEAASLPYYEEDLDQAKALLKEAGYENGFDTVLQVSPAYYADVPTAQIIQQQVARVGIRIKLQQAEWGKELNDYLKTAQPLSMIGLIPQPDPDGDIFDIFYSKSAINLGKWADPEVDRLLQLGRTTYGVQRRAKIYRRIQWIVANQVYMLFPFATPGLWEMWRDDVRGYVPTPGKHRVFLRQTWLA